MPVFTVGVGRDHLSHDVQVTRAETPRRVLKGSNLVVDVVVAQTGYAGQKVPLVVEDAGRDRQHARTSRCRPTASRRRCTCGSWRREPGRACSGSGFPCRTTRKCAEQPARRAHRGVRPAREDPVSRGRAASGVEVHRGTATDQDSNIQVVRAAADGDGQVLRAATSDGPEELQNGFPDHARGAVRLPRHHPRQRRGQRVHARAAADARRLRGRARRRAAGARRAARRSAKAAGPARRSRRRCRSSSIRPAANRTSAGRDRAHRQADARGPESSGDADYRTRRRTSRRSGASCRRSRRVNPIRDSQAGRDHAADRPGQRGREQVVLAFQRYGRGKSLAFTVQDSWLWRMHAKMPVDGHHAPHVLAAAGALARGRRAGQGHGRRPRPIGCRRASRSR